MKQLNVLILDDDLRIRSEIAEFLTNMKYNCILAERPSEAKSVLMSNVIDLMIVDINLPEMNGLRFLREVKENFVSIEVIVITGYADVSKVVEAMRLGAIDFLSKPFMLTDLEKAILRTKRYMEMSSYLKQANEAIDLINIELKKVTEINFIGNSVLSRKIVQDIKQVAESTDTSVLITGESGTGKELVARSIHLLSSRAKQPFLAVNSSAIPESLFESEMFGHKKGAFTGALNSKAGSFELADKGTLFLDEISEMNLPLQSKLLRVLGERKIRRIGSEDEIDVNVRIISASNQNLEEIIKQNKFRQDLFYRLAVFTIHLPPLRERKEDIPLLIEFYVKYFAEKMNKKVARVENDVFENLRNYYFPGNIRELKNIIERAMIICTDGILSVHMFDCLNKGMAVSSASENGNLDLELNEKNLILKALKQSNYIKSQAAKLLNITWQSLDRRLTKFNIEC